MRLIVLDTETTGLSPESGDKIVEIGAIEIANGQVLTDKTFHKLVDPQRNIPEKITRIHGIDKSALKRAKAKPFLKIGREFLAFIEGATLVIHNASFDLGFIVNELSIAELPDIDDMDVIDSLVLARQKYPEQLNNLGALCDRLKIYRKHSQAHGALVDASLLANVYLEMTKNDSEIKHIRKVRDYFKSNQIEQVNPNNSFSVSSIVADLYREFEERHSDKVDENIQTGFDSLDHLTNGLHKGDLIIIGGRPGMGKSSFAIDLTSNIAYRNDKNFKVIVFSLEMSSHEWTKRMLASEAWVDTPKLYTGKLSSSDWRNLASASGFIAESAIHIDDTNSISIQELCSKCIMLKERLEGLDLIVIDSLQLMRGHENAKNYEQTSLLSG